MTTPDLLTTVGFERRKLGNGDKEVGYAIRSSNLVVIAVGIVAFAAVLSFAVVWSLFEIRFERRHAHHELRVEEHHAALKLARVEMELWSELRADVHESQEARVLLQSLNASYEELTHKLRNSIGKLCRDNGLHAEKATLISHKVLHLIVEHRQETIRHAKTLVDHLVNVGKKSAKLEKKLERKMDKEMKQEINMETEEASLEEDGMKDPPQIKMMVVNFWRLFDKFHSTYPDAIKLLKKDAPAFQMAVDLWKRAEDQDIVLGEDELDKELQAIDLKNLGMEYIKNSNEFTQDPYDFLEMVVAVPGVPFVEMGALEQEWKAGTKDSYAVLEQLREWKEAGRLPETWVAESVSEEEEEDREGEEDGENEDPEEVVPEEAVIA